MSSKPIPAGPAFASAYREEESARGAWMPGLLQLGLVALLLAEVALLRGSIDTDRFLADERTWAKLLLATRDAAPLGIATLAAWVLVGWSALTREYVVLAQRSRGARSVALGLALHGLVYAAFFGLTRWTFYVLDARDSALALGWVATWGLAALAVPLTAAAAAFPLGALRTSLRRLAPSVLVATGIGLAALLLYKVILTSALSVPLQAATAELARGLLELVTGEPGPTEPFVLAAGGFEVIVGSQCSGLEGVALTWTFLAAYFLWFRQSLRFPQALLLVPIATFLVWCLNGVRLAALVWIGDRWSPAMAMEGFHSYAGWIVFTGLSLAVVHASQRIPWFARDARAALPADGSGTVNPAALYLGPFLGVLAVSFVTGAFTSGFDAAYPLRVLVGLLILWRVRSELPRIQRVLSWTGIAYGVAAFALWIALERLGLQARESVAPQALAELSPLAAGTWLGFRVLGFLVVAPLAEELAFRGFLARRLVASDFEALSYRALTPLSWCVSSLAFGLLHGQWVAATLAGALFALASMQRGRLGDAVVAHATTNALLILSSLVLGPWHSWL